MGNWIIILAAIGDGAETTTFATLLRGAVIGCSVILIIQLMTLWGTRWGDRYSVVKSFFLSLFVHLCFILGWASVVESNRLVSASNPLNEPQPEPMAINVLRDDPVEQPNPDDSPSRRWPGAAPTLVQIPPSERRLPSEAGIEELASVPTPRPAIPPEEFFDETVLDLNVDSLEPDEGDVPAVPLGPTPQIARKPVPGRSLETKPPEMETSQSPEPAPNQAVKPRARRFMDEGVDETPVAAKKVPPILPSQLNDAAFDEPMRLSPSEVTPFESPEPMDHGPAPSISAVPPRSISADNAVKLPQEPPERTVNRMSTNRMVLKGTVLDSVTGEPLPGARVRIDRILGQASSAVSGADGKYEIVLTEAPDHFAVTVTLDGFLPDSKNVRRSTPQRNLSRVDFSLQTSNKSTVVLEEVPTVHHLGNDRFEGRINSQFQRRSEGESVSVKFQVAPEQLRLKLAQAEMVFMAKGMQCAPNIRINGRLLRKLAELSPADGSFGRIELPFDVSLLKSGENVVSLHAVDCNGDLDDFEFVNLQIKLLPPKSSRSARSGSENTE